MPFLFALACSRTKPIFPFPSTEPCHVKLGVAVDSSALREDERYKDLVRRYFSLIVPENAMKFDALRTKGASFAGADEIVRFAEDNRQEVRGHTLVWHRQLVSWLLKHQNQQRAEAILERHVKDVVGHYRGRVSAWDVVNEAIVNDGTLRRSYWWRTIGKHYIEKAFHWAHEADPAARLFYNDYDLPFSQQKFDAVVDLIKSLKASGARVDGVGFQLHLTLEQAEDSIGKIESSLRAMSNNVDEVFVSELDIRMAESSSNEDKRRQDNVFEKIFSICSAIRNCTSITVWGATDRYSWVPSTFSGLGYATLVDSNYKPKPGMLSITEKMEKDRCGR